MVDFRAWSPPPSSCLAMASVAVVADRAGVRCCGTEVPHGADKLGTRNAPGCQALGELGRRPRPMRPLCPLCHLEHPPAVCLSCRPPSNQPQWWQLAWPGGERSVCA